MLCRISKLHCSSHERYIVCMSRTKSGNSHSLCVQHVHFDNVAELLKRFSTVLRPTIRRWPSSLFPLIILARAGVLDTVISCGAVETYFFVRCQRCHRHVGTVAFLRERYFSRRTAYCPGGPGRGRVGITEIKQIAPHVPFVF